MTGVVHSLSASITSALAVKPSTVYVLRVENTLTRDVWHIRRCFSEFCDLRERMLALIDGNSSSANASYSNGMGSAQNSPTTATVAVTAMRLLSFTPSLRGSSSPTSNTNSPRALSPAGSGPVQERFPHLYAKFPRRQFFGSRTRKVIEQRTLALNQFLQEALWCLREVKTQPNIAVYFSLMTQLEAFFDCGKHQAKTSKASTNSPPPAGMANNTGATGLCPAFYPLLVHSSQKTLIQAPVMPLPGPPTRSYSSSETTASRSTATEDAAERARAVAARGFWHAPRHDDHLDEDDESDEEVDDYEERQVLKKTISCFMNHEVRERRVTNPASQFVAALQTRASERDAAVSAADAWAARIEIAGIAPTEALRRRSGNDNSNRAMLVKQYSSPALSGKSASETTTAVVYSMNDRLTQLRPECRT